MNGNESARDWLASHDGIHSVFVNEDSNSMLMSVFTITEEKLFQRTSQSPRMFQRYLFISCVSSSTFPAAVSNRTFQVPIVMLFLARSDFGSSVAYFSPSNGTRGPCSGRRPSRYGLNCGYHLHVV